MGLLKQIWRFFEKIALFVGNIITSIVMVIFYFTIFAVFAIPFKIFGKTLFSKTKNSSWILKVKSLETLEDFRGEF